jgi:hypothetical protein
MKESKTSVLEKIIKSYLEKSSLTVVMNSRPKTGIIRKEPYSTKKAKTFLTKNPKTLSNGAERKIMPNELLQSPWKNKRNISLLRPATASPPSINRRMNRPKTASPKFHRHRIKVRPPHSDGKHKSKESWIPEEIRQKMLKRELAVAMVNFEAKETCNSSMKHITRRNSDSLERCLSKEKFGIEQRKSCGLCCVKFLPVNLVLAVPLKAVLDIRDSWGDKYDPEGSRRVRVNPNLRKAPACYNSTRVCAFCAQLFDQQQDTYRPSWEAKEAEKERIKDLEEEAQRKVENDPLSQIEKERDAEVNELTQALTRQKTKRDHEASLDHPSRNKAKTPTRRLSVQSQS